MFIVGVLLYVQRFLSFYGGVCTTIIMIIITVGQGMMGWGGGLVSEFLNYPGWGLSSYTPH